MDDIDRYEIRDADILETLCLNHDLTKPEGCQGESLAKFVHNKTVRAHKELGTAVKARFNHVVSAALRHNPQMQLHANNTKAYLMFHNGRTTANKTTFAEKLNALLSRSKHRRTPAWSCCPTGTHDSKRPVTERPARNDADGNAPGAESTGKHDVFVVDADNCSVLSKSTVERRSVMSDSLESAISQREEEESKLPVTERPTENDTDANRGPGIPDQPTVASAEGCIAVPASGRRQGLPTQCQENNTQERDDRFAQEHAGDSAKQPIVLGSRETTPRPQLYDLEGVISQLNGNEWLSDETIRYIADILAGNPGGREKDKPSVMHPLWFESHFQPDKKSRRIVENVPVFIPLHHSRSQDAKHWTLCKMVERETSIYIEHFDSLASQSRVDCVRREMQDWARQHIGGKEVVFESRPCAQQDDASSCGLYVLAFLISLLRQEPVPQSVDIVQLRSSLLERLQGKEDAPVHHEHNIEAPFLDDEALRRRQPLSLEDEALHRPLSPEALSSKDVNHRQPLSLEDAEAAATAAMQQMHRRLTVADKTVREELFAAFEKYRESCRTLSNDWKDEIALLSQYPEARQRLENNRSFSRIPDRFCCTRSGTLISFMPVAESDLERVASALKRRFDRDRS